MYRNKIWDLKLLMQKMQKLFLLKPLITELLCQKYLRQKTFLSKCTGTRYAGTWCGWIDPTGANMFRGHRPHNQLSVAVYATWHTMTLQLLSFSLLNNSVQRTLTDIFSESNKTPVLNLAHISSCSTYSSRQCSFCFVTAELPGEVNHLVLSVHTWHSLHNAPLTFKAGWAHSERII